MSSRQHLDRLLNDYRRQVLRWNRQINLVSRLDTEEMLQGLIHQCRGAWDRLTASGSAGLSSAADLWYFDLGSGAGLPGFVWHAQAVAGGLPVRTWLVEPREKRAWFLNRLNNLGCPEPVIVRSARWGDLAGDDFGVPAGEPAPSHVLISLKALHLTDVQVLEGLNPLLSHLGPVAGDGGPVTVLIVRFYPPEQAWNQKLADDLEIPGPGGVHDLAGRSFRGLGGKILPALSPRGAGLVLSAYMTDPA